MSGKNSFILYFDMYPSIQNLPLEQRGALLSAIFELAKQTVQQPDCAGQILAMHPELGEAGKMAFSFIAQTIERDTVKWREKQARYQAAAEKRWEQAGQSGKEGRRRGTGQGSVQCGDPWAYVE